MRDDRLEQESIGYMRRLTCVLACAGALLLAGSAGAQPAKPAAKTPVAPKPTPVDLTPKLNEIQDAQQTVITQANKLQETVDALTTRVNDLQEQLKAA